MANNRKPLLALAIALAAIVVAGIWWTSGQSILEKLPETPDLSRSDALQAAAARALAEIAEAEDPAAPLAELAMLYHGNGHLPEAARCYEILGQLQPTEARWRHLHASVISSYGQTELAAPLYQQAVDLAPDYLPARLNLADALLKSRRYAEAADAYQSALELRPDNGDALIGLARAALATDDPRAAEGFLKRAIATKDVSPSAWRLLGTVYRALGDPARASEADARSVGHAAQTRDPWIDETLDYCFDTYRLSVESISSYERGDSKRGQALLERAAEVDPADGAVQRDLGRRLMFEGKIPAAIARLDRAIELDPTDPEAWLSRAQIAADFETPQALASLVTRGLARCPDSPGLHFEKGRLLSKSGRYDLAALSFERSIELNPQKPEPYIELAGARFRLGDLEAAEAALQACLRADPKNPLALSIYARYVIGEKSQEEARALLSRSLEHPEMPARDKRAIEQAYRDRFGAP